MKILKSPPKGLVPLVYMQARLLNPEKLHYLADTSSIPTTRKSYHWFAAPDDLAPGSSCYTDFVRRTEPDIVVDIDENPGTHVMARAMKPWNENQVPEQKSRTAARNKGGTHKTKNAVARLAYLDQRADEIAAEAPPNLHARIQQLAPDILAGMDALRPPHLRYTDKTKLQSLYHVKLRAAQLIKDKTP